VSQRTAASPDDELHGYFSNVAAARYVIRKVFRLIDEEARATGLEPLEHQALIQLFGSSSRTLQMKDLAERLDVGADVASKLVSSLEAGGYARRVRSSDDRRAINVTATAAAERKLAEIDVRVREDISLLQRDWPRGVQLAALETFAFYAGLAVDPDVLAGIEVRRVSVNPPWAVSAASGQK
jgi:DNA-binding MarR family transcriptional regulator